MAQKTFKNTDDIWRALQQVYRVTNKKIISVRATTSVGGINVGEPFILESTTTDNGITYRAITSSGISDSVPEWEAFSGGGGASVPTQQHIFASVTARDTYFTANPADLRTGLPIFVTITTNTELQIWGAPAQTSYNPAPPDNDDDNWVNAGTFSGTAAQIKALYESNLDTNAFTDAEQTKLAGIENSATADQTPSEIKISYESNLNTNPFTDAEQTKLSAIENNATADLTASEVKALYESNLNTNDLTDSEKAAIATSVQAAASQGTNIIRFTRENATTFDVTISVANRPAGVDTAGGALLNLRPESEDWSAASNFFPSNASSGYTYIVSAPGTVDNIEFSRHDLLIALIDNPSISTYAGNWQKVEGGVHSWGGLVGVISDQNIIDKLNRLGFTVNTSYAAPSVHNFSVNIPSRVDIGTDLNVLHQLVYAITNRQNVQSFELLVTVGDNKTLVNPTVDGIQTQNVIFSGVDSSSASTLLLQLRITDTQNNTHDSNSVTISIRNLLTQEQVHFGIISSTENETNINFTSDDIEARDTLAGDWTVSGIPSTGTHIFYIGVPTSLGSVTSVFQGSFNLTNQFTNIPNVIIDGQTYNIFLMNTASAVTSLYNGTILTFS